ncbi:pathogenicity island protein [Salmonella enterica subsp. enterica]|nr:pathogenicity island protein [Salmonella enterica subsp. enterica]
MAVRLTFDGQKLTWPGIGIFKATTGLPDLQWPDKQCVPDAAIPEGNYKLFIQFQGEAPIRNAADCDLGPSWGWSTIPRGQAAGTCEIYWANWGYNRIRLESAD